MRSGSSGSRSRGAVPGSRHGPNKLSNYIEIHRTWMHRFLSDGFVLSDGVEGVAKNRDERKRPTTGEVLMELRDCYLSHYEKLTPPS